MRPLSPRFDLTGQVFGRLTVIDRLEADRRKWACRCSCGNTRNIPTSDLTSGHTKSCGCFMVENIIARSTTHGHAARGAYDSTYNTWAAMIQRCTNTSLENYPRYGGRGITVCERWRESFVAFLEDVGNRPEGTSIERINNDGNYELSNVRWATRAEQSNNKANSRRVEYEGAMLTVAELADRVDLPYDALYKRLFYRRMSVADAIAKPCARRRQAAASGSVDRSIGQ